MPGVLIIDDDQMVAQMLNAHLTNEGHQVTWVSSGEEGFKNALKNPPGLIMLDVNLPDATGFQMCSRFRENITTKNVPIIMMSGAARWPNQQKIGRELGADDYILKPFDVIKVGERVNELMGSAPAPSKQEPAEPPAAATPAPSTPAAVVEPPLAEHPPMIANYESFPTEPAAALEPEFAPQTPTFEEPPPPARESILPPLENQLPEPESPDSESEPEPFESGVAATSTTFANSPSGGLTLVWGLLALHVISSVITAGLSNHPSGSFFQTVSWTLGGWALLFGLFIGSAAFAKVSLDIRRAVRMLGLAAIPIVLRSLLALAAAGLGIPALRSALDGSSYSTTILWLRPLDAFEMAGILILGMMLRGAPGSSLKKAFLISLLIAATWILAGHGYFRP